MYDTRQSRDLHRIGCDHFDPLEKERELKEYAVSLEPHELIRLTFALIEAERQRDQSLRAAPVGA